MSFNTNPLRYWMRTTLSAIVILMALLISIQTAQATESCDNTTATCEEMCAHIYTTCSMSFQDSSDVAMTETECVAACGSTDPAVVSCLAAITCNLESIDSCLVNATASSGSGSSEDSGGSYIGGGGVADDSGGSTNSGGCGAITDCNSCITNCRCRYDGTAAASTCCTGCGCECELFCMPTDWWIATCM